MSVAVGTAVSRRPPHGSLQAVLPHRAPALDHDGTGSPFFGFDFTQLNGTSDTLWVSAAAAVPEPASLGLLAMGGIALLRRRSVPDRNLFAVRAR